jgi:uncharacterized protein (TIGR02246 family)
MNESGEAITQVVNGYQDAIHAKDARALVELYASDVRVFDLWGEWAYDGVDAWRGAVEGWFGSLGSELVVVDIEVIRTSGTHDLAIIEAFVVYSAVSDTGETLRAMRNRLTWVLKPVMSAWKIAHEHTSAPVDPASMKVMLNAENPG